MKRVGVIFNPRSGRNSGERAARLVGKALADSGISTETRSTTRPGDAATLARAAVGEFDALFAVGGDGTVAEVLAGLVDHLDMPIGVVPIGAANVLARELKIPLQAPAFAARALARGVIRGIDFGWAGERPFLVNAGAGFDAMVVHALSARRRERQRPIGMGSYLPVGFHLLLRYRAPRLKLIVDGLALDGEYQSAAVCNSRNYGGVMSLTPDAEIDDGLLDLCARRRAGRGAVLRHLIRALTRRTDPHAAVYLRGRSFRIERAARAGKRGAGGTSEATQVDGEPHATLPLEIRIFDRQARFLVPRGGPSST